MTDHVPAGDCAEFLRDVSKMKCKRKMTVSVEEKLVKFHAQFFGVGHLLLPHLRGEGDSVASVLFDGYIPENWRFRELLETDFQNFSVDGENMEITGISIDYRSENGGAGYLKTLAEYAKQFVQSERDILFEGNKLTIRFE